MYGQEIGTAKPRRSLDDIERDVSQPAPTKRRSLDEIESSVTTPSSSSYPTPASLSPRKQATLRNVTGLQSELTATSPQPKPGETVDVSTGEMYKPSQPFHSPKLDYKPEGIAPRPQSFDNRTQRAARTARQIEDTKRQAVQLFRQADQTPDTPDATGISGRQKLRAQAEGKVEGANELARRAQKQYGDLLEIGFGKDTDPNSRRQWAYAKAKTPTARAARDTVDLQAANAERFANPRGQLNQALTPAPPQNYRQHLNVRAVPKPEESELSPEESELSPEEQNALAARHQVAEEARQQIAAQNPGAVSRAILGAASVPVHALSGLASIPRRITGTAPGQLETSIGALGDVMASGAQPTPETQGTFSAGNLGTLAGFIPTMAVGGRILKPITPATPLGSAISSGAQFANIAGGEGVSNREMARQGLIGGGVGAASELAGGAANRALAGKLANAELTPAQAAVAGRVAQGAAGGGAFAGQSALMGQRDPETLAKEALLGAAMGAAHSPRFREAQEAARQQGINDIRQQIDRRSAMNEAALRPQEVSQTVPAPMPARAASVPNAQEPAETLTEPLESAMPPSAIPQLPAPENFNARRAKLLGIDAPPEVAINEQIQTADKLLNSPNEGDQRQGRALMNRALTAIRQSEGYLNETTATEGEKPYTATRAAIEARLKPADQKKATGDQELIKRGNSGLDQPVSPLESLGPGNQQAGITWTGPAQSTGQRLIENTHARAMQMAESGDYTGAITELQSHQRALRDEKARQMKAAKEPGRRVQIERDFNRQIGDAGARIGEIRQQKRMAERQANKPTAGLPKTSIKSEQNQQESAPLLRPEAVQNPEGGIPQMPEQTFSGRLERGIRRDQAAQEKAQPAKRILSRIAELGGIDERHAGELQDVKDARRIGVIRKRAQMSPDVLARQLQSEGYHVDPENLDTLWEAARRDIAGRNERTANTGELNQRLANEEAAHYAKQEEAPEAAQAPADNATLYSAFRKLNTDDPAEISQMVRDADKRFKKSATTGEIAASRAAWEKVSQLTEAEQNALSSVLPERVFAPVKEEYQGEGNYSRAVSDFGNKETLGAQGEANYNEVMDFFDSLSAADKKITPQDVQAVRESLNRASWAKEHAQEHAKDIPALAVIAEGRDGESVRWMQLYDKLQSEGKLNATETGTFNQLGRQLGLSAKFIRGAVAERGRPARRSQEQAETPARSAQAPQGQSANSEASRRPEAAQPTRQATTEAKLAEVDRQLGWDLISKEEAARQKARILKEAEAQPKAREQKAPGFFSQLGRVIDQKMPAKASAQQVRNIIENPQSGIKPDEVKWTGLDDYLRGKETVTKAEVQEFLKANQVDVQEVTKGQSLTERTRAAMRDAANHQDWRRYDELQQESDTAPTKYGKYTLPGAKEGSYRELLLTLPEQATYVDRIVVSPRTEAVTGKKTKSVAITFNDSLGGGFGSTVRFGVNEKGVIDNVDNIKYRSTIGKPLDEVLGKELSERIMGAERATLEGEGLKIGGEGMKGFYDQILPAFANKYAKKWGARVGEAKIKTGSSVYEENKDLYGDDFPMDFKTPETSVHSIDITPAMRESVMQGQALFQHGQTEAPTASQSLADAKIQFKSGKRGQAGTLYANEPALDVMRAAYEEVFGNRVEFSNVNLNAPAARRMAKVLTEAANDPDFDTATQRRLREVAREFDAASRSGETVSIVSTAEGRKFSDIKVSRRHELFHDAQEGLQNSPGFLAKHKYSEPLIEGLAHYAPEDRTVEAAAFIAGGQAKDFGLTEKQGNEFLEDYFNDIVKTNGPAALKRFFSVAPLAVETLQKAKEKYGIQGQTGKNNSGTARTGDIGRSSAENRPSREGEGVLRPAQPGRSREQRRIRASFGELETEPRGQIAASGLGGLQNLFNRKPSAAKPAQVTPLPKNWNLANWSQRFYREAMAAGLSKADRANFAAAKTPRDKNAVLMGATIDPKHEQAVFDVIDKADSATTAKDGSALYDAMVDATNMLRHKPTERGYERFKKEAGNAISLPRALMASADISAPLRQGAILTLPPTQWGKAAKATVRMFESFSTKQYERISKEINLHPDAETARDSGLYLSTDKSGLVTKKEEDFISHWADKIPIVKHSEQAYKAYLDSLRMDTFARYKKSIDKTKGLSAEQKENGYKAAANWINVATGRGTLGETFENAMPALSKVMFAPRYTASRIQVLNPMTYAKNMRTAEGRAVLKNQMSDLVQYAGVISATLALAAANGAQVGLNPDDPDFLKIKVGNIRYDTLAGLQQPMRLFYRMGKSLYGRATGQKVNSRESALDIASRFGRSKLAPIPSFFVDYFSGRDFTGQPFKPSKAVIDRVVPLMWKDFYDAYQTEGLAGGLKTLPGATGIGVQNYGEKPGTLKPSAFTREASQMGKNFELIKPKANEPDDVFNARKQRVEGWMSTYGDKLINNPRYSLLTEDEKKAAIKLLRDRIGRQQNLKTPKLATFEPNAVLLGVKKSQANKPKQARKQLWTPNTP